MSTTPRALAAAVTTAIHASIKPDTKHQPTHRVQPDTIQRPDTSHLEGRYLTFTLGRQQFAIPAQKVRQVVGLCPLDQRERMPSYMRGSLALRGQSIPVVSLRARLGMPDPTPTGKEAIIVFDLGLDVGLIVDEVNEVTHFNAAQIAPPSPIVTAAGCTFIKGVANVLGLANPLNHTNGHAKLDERPEIPMVGSTIRHAARRTLELAHGPLQTVTLLEVAEVVETDALQAIMQPVGHSNGFFG